MSVKRKSTDGLENESSGKKHPKTSKVKLEKSSDVKPQSPADKAKVSKSSQLKPNVIKSKHHDKPNKQDKKNKPTIKENENEKPKKIKTEIKKIDKENINGTNPQGKDENNHERREKKKKLKSERQSKKKNVEVFDLGVQAKKVWNRVRGDDCPENERNKLLSELHSLVKGNIKKIVYARETSRVIQCLYRKSNASIREAIYEELKDDIVTIAKSKYGSFLIKKLIKYGNKEQKSKIMKSFEGRVAALTKHKTANVIISLAYSDFAKTSQRNRFLQEFYGSEYRICKEDDLKSSVDVVKKYPKKEAAIRNALADNCSLLISKGCYDQNIVHSVFYDYMLLLNFIINKHKEPDSLKEESNISNDDQEVKEPIDVSKKARAARAEFIAQLRDVCVHILHSFAGARVTMNSLWHGSSKDRKAIVKSFKTFVPKICNEEFGHRVMLAAFDSIDDTKLLTKAVIDEIIGDGKEDVGNINEIFASGKAGRNVLLYLLAGRDATYFAPDYLALLKEGDGNEYTKKDDSTRRKELIASSEGGIYRFLSDNLFGLLKADPKCTVFIRAALNCAYASIEKVKPAMERLSDIASDKFVVGEENFVESPAGHQLLKKIIIQDKIRHSEGGDTFSKMLLDQINAKNSLESYIGCNRGAFLLVTIMETGVPDLQQLVKDCLKQYGKALGAQSTRGAELLVQKLNLHK